MSRADRPDLGFTFVELLVAMVIGMLLLTAIYRTVVVQERAMRTQQALASTQDNTRTALEVLTTELREVSADPAASAGTDIGAIGPDSIRFRAYRKAGVVCARSTDDVEVQQVGDALAAQDSVLVFVENDPKTVDDDDWLPLYVGAVSGGTGCASWTGYTRRLLGTLGAPGTWPPTEWAGILAGAPVRAFTWLTYGLYQDAGGRYMLGRHADGAAVTMLLGPLASPDDGGLRFTYYDADGAVTSDPTQVERIVISVKAQSPTGPRLGQAYQDSLVTQLYLRNN